jgi:hypothetical protein
MGAFSNLGEFSDAQALVASAASTNTIDLATTRQQIGVGVPIYICIRVGTAFTTSTSYAFQLEMDSTVAFGSAAVFPLRNTIAIASLTAGAWVYRNAIPYECTERHIRLYYTETGSAESTGTIDAWLDLSPRSDFGANAQVWSSPVGDP